jgi:hypothetical protein
MATLETQYQNYLKENPSPVLTYDEWLNKVHSSNTFKKQYETRNIKRTN